MLHCFLNGQFLPLTQAHIAVNDRGFLLADGFFTTIRCYQGKPFVMQAHWQRLEDSAQLLRIKMPISYPDLLTACHTLINMNELSLQDSSLRITITRGQGARGLAMPLAPTSTLLIQNHPLATPTTQELSITCNYEYRIAPTPLCAIKSLAYTTHILARQQAICAGYDEVILLNSHHEIVSSSCANIFLVKQQQLFTPQHSCGIVHGVMRNIIIQLAQEERIPCHSTSLHVLDLRHAQEVFLTNSLIGIQSVSRYNNTHFAIDDDAKITQFILLKLHQFISQTI